MELFRFIDWLLVLPAVREQEFWHELRQFEEERYMPYVTSVERRGFEQGQLQATRDAVLEVVSTQLGAVPEDITEAVQQLENVEALRVLLREAATCSTLEAFWESVRVAHG